MADHLDREAVIDGVRRWTVWMVKQRMAKLREETHHTMSINPFLVPILFELHHAESFAELGELLLAGHLMTGHTTSFGKLVDEKILPDVFGTSKLDKGFRGRTPPLDQSPFDDIDHLVPRPGGPSDLLSLKASKWTIQLASAVNLNRSFAEILGRAPGARDYPGQFGGIVVGVLTGKPGFLTDKYDILRGINRGANHSVIDLQDAVTVLAGRDFWTWLNGGQPGTQDWVLDGVMAGLRDAECREECRSLLVGYADTFNQKYAHHINDDGTVNWHQMLAEVNG